MTGIESARGVTVVVDPYGLHLEAYADPNVHADVVLVSHNHSDHANVEMVKGTPRVIRGVEGGTVRPIDVVVDPSGGARIRSIASYHDKLQGRQKGHNAMFLIEVDGFRILHMGDIGQSELTDTQVKQIGDVDVLFIPVGGRNTVNAVEALGIIAQVGPQYIVPMHYGVPGLRLPLDTLDMFLGKLPASFQLRRVKGNAFRPSIPSGQKSEGPQVVVLEPTLKKRSVASERGISLPASLLAQYVGKYQLAPGFVLTITLKDDGLFVQPTGQVGAALYAEAENRFFFEIADTKVSFERNEQGEVTGLVLHQEGQDMPAARVP